MTIKKSEIRVKTQVKVSVPRLDRGKEDELDRLLGAADIVTASTILIFGLN